MFTFIADLNPADFADLFTKISDEDITLNHHHQPSWSSFTLSAISSTIPLIFLTIIGLSSSPDLNEQSSDNFPPSKLFPKAQKIITALSQNLFVHHIEDTELEEHPSTPLSNPENLQAPGYEWTTPTLIKCNCRPIHLDTNEESHIFLNWSKKPSITLALIFSHVTF